MAAAIAGPAPMAVARTAISRFAPLHGDIKLPAHAGNGVAGKGARWLRHRPARNPHGPAEPTVPASISAGDRGARDYSGQNDATCLRRKDTHDTLLTPTRRSFRPDYGAFSYDQSLTNRKIKELASNAGEAQDQDLERVKGIEPSYSAWKAAALPLSYTRAFGLPPQSGFET